MRMPAFRNALAALAVLASAALPALAADLPLFDAHIHFSHDARERLSAQEAASRLRAAGLNGALVSSSDDEGTQQLLRAAPELVVPSLRPYRKRSDLGTWTTDPSVLDYVRERLAKHRYVAIGEFHVSGEAADLPVVKELVAIAKSRGLMLWAHSDADAVERLFRHDPQARILWAHAGFEPPSKVLEMMRRHRNLWADLSFRHDVAGDGGVSESWRPVFEAMPDRFMVGTDTYTPQRWDAVSVHAAWARQWLATLPAPLARRIAHENAQALFRR